MPDYRRGAHTVFEIHLHLVWITKYRRLALSGEVATRVRDLIRDICAEHEVKIMKGTWLRTMCTCSFRSPRR
jgi:putative transposase